MSSKKHPTTDGQIHVVLQSLLDQIRFSSIEAAVISVTKAFNSQEEQINKLFYSRAAINDSLIECESRCLSAERRLQEYEEEEHNRTIELEAQLEEVLEENEILKKRLDNLESTDAIEKWDMAEDAISLKGGDSEFTGEHYFKEKMSVLDKLHYIEDSNVIFNPIYNIHYCNAGIGLVMYDPTKDIDGNYKDALSVEKYYPTFEDCIEAEYARLKEMENEANDDEEKRFNMLCLDIYYSYHGTTLVLDFEPWNNNNQLLDVVDIVHKTTKIPLVLSDKEDNIYDTMREYIILNGQACLSPDNEKLSVDETAPMTIAVRVSSIGEAREVGEELGYPVGVGVVGGLLPQRYTAKNDTEIYNLAVKLLDIEAEIEIYKDLSVS